eukprot:CAMPEP_0185006192 /NCGR_PEP_ID=MMETSP1098-20130426/83933_1 /TAXON_ID=89044 /ORGANISM="Spumella elongata, Strain CCAP 955/1" /LENGTH=2045 /DNA_ID=CAMNT_0027534327 /DNA_START=353 /DNA_END=6490 /DNA_ORIENTATION=+
MSINIPTLSDTAWAVNGSYRHDYGGKDVTHYCVFLSPAYCALPSTTDFSKCKIRCFGHGFGEPAIKLQASKRSVTDLYPGQERWPDDGAVDLWTYPKNCDTYDGSCTYSGYNNAIPSFNPQGFVFTYAGSGEKGFLDGPHNVARFNSPEDVAVDEAGVLYVADTQNNAIRRIDLQGNVITLAGSPHPRANITYNDGNCSDATFLLPKGLDVRHETINGEYLAVVIVADTGNHRIRRIEYNEATKRCWVSCLTGLCGNNSLSATEFQTRAEPLTGYADGNRLEARFSAPESVAFMKGDYFVVADTGNFLLRWVVASNGTTETLAGTVVRGPRDSDGNPLPGCTPPCLAGQQGYRDGNLTNAAFYNPVDVTRGPNNTVWVADEQRIRIVELPHVISTFYSIRSTGRVSTIAGDSQQGHDDGLSQLSNFFYSSGVFVTKDNIAYVVDAATCRIRRITPFPSVAEDLTCDASPAGYIRPSGCTSFDQPIDKIGRKVSRVERNVQYNFGSPYELDKDKGKYIKNCVGIPPQDLLDKRFVNITGDNLVIDDYRVAINEDSEQGVSILFNCPRGCGALGAAVLEGTGWYSESSSVCLAAIHDGRLTNRGGLVQIILERKDYLQGSLITSLAGSTRHGLTSKNIPPLTSRVFSIVPFNVSNSMVHTVAGTPSAPLESGCGFADAKTPMDAKFTIPSGIAARYGDSLSESNYLYIADTGNHRIRSLSATCTQICENGGRCVGPDQCQCKPGWTGVDCTTPVCSAVTCGANKVCVAPDTCACKPGYAGPNCDRALCMQHCSNNGVCSAPDTCSCPTGWFDTNCTTPVCANTCANGGNCIGPSKCDCPAEWTGPDCRTPVCKQNCNNGFCVAPNTCACSPQYTGVECNIPVCTQGYFEANTEFTNSSLFNTTIFTANLYKNCDLQSWCNATNEFECDQTELVNTPINVPWGPLYRNITGRKTAPNQCMYIELPINFKVPYQLLYSNGENTGNVRYSPPTPYTSYFENPWRGYLKPTEQHTGPWTYSADRQVANVQWLQVTQGLYVCANEGKCVAPDVCSCAPGWIGFDCRTPVCDFGYYFEDKEDPVPYVSGQHADDELELFEKFLDPRQTYRLDWNYSNPAFVIEFEKYDGPNTVERDLVKFNGTFYHAELNKKSLEGEFVGNAFVGNYSFFPQGGYRCTIRADTEWESLEYMSGHPNFFSQYMDTEVQEDGKVYTFWENMRWPPTHRKTRVLDKIEYESDRKRNRTYAYTNEGYRRQGIWKRALIPNTNGQEVKWAYGLCLMEFHRVCDLDQTKSFDLYSNLQDVYVQDTDLAFRPRVTYNDQRVNSRGRWKQASGECIDNVIRGCANNGTCVKPKECACAPGWEGPDCRKPKCSQDCYLHHGNCTSPNVCTCERGWSGFDCRIPLCAQECQNGGVCVAPDTCKCNQWPNLFRDGRAAGGRPLFQDQDGEPLYTGWTGFDCATPICVQAEKFLLNIEPDQSQNPNISPNPPAGYVMMGGHGADALMTCIENNVTMPRCPQYNEYVTGNDGRSFQVGCGWDKYKTGCCDQPEVDPVTGSLRNNVRCYRCPESRDVEVDNSFYCSVPYEANDYTLSGIPDYYKDVNKNVRYCGEYHSPRNYEISAKRDVISYGVARYYFNQLEPSKSNFNRNSNYTSNLFLCNVDKWIQGDYIDDAGMDKITGVGSIYGLTRGRHVRVNTPNIIVSGTTFTRGPKVEGEGLYQCYNLGTCIGPDVCTCTDGYDGDDCNTPLCRHLQVTGAVSSCLNGGICTSKDSCDCVQTGSVLWQVHPTTARGLTGWTGTDCSMPMCTQGYYDPFCGDLPQAPGAEGCFRCSNGGNCTAPDVCTCAKGWTGFDCKTPVCETVADPLTRIQLGTVFEDKVIAFESDPCGVTAIYGKRGWKGTKYNRGNCTQPDQCTCLCKVPYNRKSCHKTGKLCDGPWQDNMVTQRNLPGARGPEYTFGTRSCQYGYEGNVDELDRFTTCHQTIYVPSATERDSLVLIIVLSVLGFLGIILYDTASRRLKRRFLLAKIERRRTRRDSEASMQSGERSSVIRQSI